MYIALLPMNGSSLNSREDDPMPINKITKLKELQLYKDGFEDLKENNPVMFGFYYGLSIAVAIMNGEDVRYQEIPNFPEKWLDDVIK